MLDPRWLLALILLDVWALWARHALLAFVCTFCLSCAAAIKFWQRWSLRGVTYQRSLGRERAQLGEVVSFSASFANDKLMPLSLLEVYDSLPRYAKLTGGTLRDDDSGIACLYIARAMLPFTRITRRFEVRCERRGLHTFGPVRMRASDFLGVLPQHGGDNSVHELLVLPKIFALDLGTLSFRQLLGRVRAPRQLLDDPLSKRGARTYRAGDPLRSVDWRASARSSSLMVRELEPSAAPALQVILDFSIHAPAGDRVEPDELEFAIGLAASIAAYADQHGMAVGLFGNGTSGGKLLALPASRARDQVACVLELLARASSRPFCPLAAVLSQLRTSATSAGTWLVITDHLTADALRLLRDAERRGQPVTVLWTGAARPAAASLRTLHGPYSKGWWQRDALTIAV